MLKEPPRPSISPDNLELPPFNERVVNQYIARLKSTEIKKCDMTPECAQAATFYVSVHGCDGDCVCRYHKQQWLAEIMDEFVDGHQQCPDCGVDFYDLDDIAQERKI